MTNVMLSTTDNKNCYLNETDVSIRRRSDNPSYFSIYYFVCLLFANKEDARGYVSVTVFRLGPAALGAH